MDLSGFIRKSKTVEVNGKRLIFSQLVLGDIARVRALAQEKKNAETKKKREQIVELAKSIGTFNPMELLKYVDSPLTEAEEDAYFESIDGMAMLLMLSLKPFQPDITESDVRSIFDIGTMVSLVPFIVSGKDGEAEEKKKELPIEAAGQ